MNYLIPDSDEELLRECRVQVFRGSGPGGQSVNTTDSAVRLIHKPSGLMVVARRERSQLLNKRAALARLRRRLEAANQLPRLRLATQPSRTSIERRLVNKRHQALKKKQRRQAPDE
ncbi:MAG: peptide chain release factor-like protein [Coriobacteriia bacterium]|nr:peptide chain release factor-like protein [Coriobacteriia bacterium]